MAFLALAFRQLTAFSNYALVQDSRETWILTDSENYSLLFYLEQLTFLLYASFSLLAQQ